MQAILATVKKSIFGNYKFIPERLRKRDSNGFLFDGWDSFIHDAHAQLSKKPDAYEYVKEHQAVNYELRIRHLIAEELKRRTHTTPDLNKIKEIEHEAAMSIDYPRQLAYMVFLYEHELKETTQDNSLQYVVLPTKALS